MPPDFTALLPDLLADALRRTQLLIHPILTQLDPSILPPPSTALDSRGGLLRFGGPSTKNGGTSDFRSPVAVAGKRFGLYSIAA